MYRIGRTLSPFAVVALAAVGLSGCSSGGGGGGVAAASPRASSTATSPRTRTLAANYPKFGSVTQSSNAVGGGGHHHG